MRQFSKRRQVKVRPNISDLHPALTLETFTYLTNHLLRNKTGRASEKLEASRISYSQPREGSLLAELHNMLICKCNKSRRLSQPGVVQPRQRVFEFRAICCRGSYGVFHRSARDELLESSAFVCCEIFLYL